MRRALVITCLVGGFAGSAVFGGTDPLQVTASGTPVSGGLSSVSDTDGTSTDGVATNGVVFVDLTVPGTEFQAGQLVGTVTVALASQSSGSGSPAYPVTVTAAQQGGPNLQLLAAPVTLSVFSPGAQPRAFPDALSVPVHITSDPQRAAGLAACVDGVPPDPLEKALVFTNPTSGRNKLGNGPNVHVRIRLSCQEAEVVFCTVSQGCLGQPGGEVGGDIAFCNDPLAGWLTRNESAVLPLTVGGAHTLNDGSTQAGRCASATYDAPAHQGQGSGLGFQTLCSRDGLIAYLPTGSTPGTFSPLRGSNRELGAAEDLMSTDRQGSGSKGSGAGVLTGQTLSLKLAVALAASGQGPFVEAEPGSCAASGSSYVCGAGAFNAGASCVNGGAPDDTRCFSRVSFVPASLASFRLPAPASGPVELCTQLSGADRHLEPSGDCGPATCDAGLCGARAANAGAACSSDAECLPASDDQCQRIVYPSCVAGATVDALVHAAEEVLSGGSSTLCGGQPAALTEALDLVNRTFDGCGKVIDCGLLD
jgi:hypothetical protein